MFDLLVLFNAAFVVALHVTLGVVSERCKVRGVSNYIKYDI